MSDQTNKVMEDSKTEAELAQEFYNEYVKLCEKHGYNIVVTPAYKLSQDTGAWYTVLQNSVGKIPRPQETA